MEDIQAAVEVLKQSLGPTPFMAQEGAICACVGYGVGGGGMHVCWCWIMRWARSCVCVRARALGGGRKAHIMCEAYQGRWHSAP